MSHIPTVLDVKTDILRSINSTFSKHGLTDRNYKYFLNNALTNLDKLKIDKKKKALVSEQITKSKDIKKDLNKIREDLLLITSLL